MLQHALLLRELRLVAARMLGDELRHGRELGDRVRGVELLELRARDELGSARVVRAEEVELAVVKRAAERKAHARGDAALRLERVADRPDERLHRALERDFGSDHEVLRPVEERRQHVAPELALGLLARHRRDTLGLGLALRNKHRLLRRALAPLLDGVRVAHHLDARAVLLLGHVGVARADHLAHRRVELVDVRRPEKDAGKSALRHAAEVALGRLDLDHLRVVVVGEMRGQRMLDDILLLRGREAARLALAERRGGLVGLRLRRDLEKDGSGVVQEEVREVLELVRVAVALKLAHDRAKRLRLRQHLHLGVERLGLLGEARPAAVAEPLAVAEGLAVAELLPVAEGLALPEWLAIAGRLPVAERLPVSLRPFGADLAHGHSGVFPRPVGREIERPERTEVELGVIFLFHIR